ncbi:MAG: DUF333 domain-containing protein [Candidatus Aenigmarchaeota archaeon]|nr:DUF333 domain-containing protein [Candidatus Aenigmarchaeota archaeon]
MSFLRRVTFALLASLLCVLPAFAQEVSPFREFVYFDINNAYGEPLEGEVKVFLEHSGSRVDVTSACLEDNGLETANLRVPPGGYVFQVPLDKLNFPEYGTYLVAFEYSFLAGSETEKRAVEEVVMVKQEVVDELATCARQGGHCSASCDTETERIHEDFLDCGEESCCVPLRRGLTGDRSSSDGVEVNIGECGPVVCDEDEDLECALGEKCHFNKGGILSKPGYECKADSSCPGYYVHLETSFDEDEIVKVGDTSVAYFNIDAFYLDEDGDVESCDYCRVHYDEREKVDQSLSGELLALVHYEEYEDPDGEQFEADLDWVGITPTRVTGERKFSMECFCGEESYWAEDSVVVNREGLPESFDVIDYMPPVEDQRICGSCWAFAISSAVSGAYAYQAYKNGDDVDAPDLSEQFLVSCLSGGGGCMGEWPEAVLEFLVEHELPIPVESCLGYSETKCPLKQTDDEGCAEYVCSSSYCVESEPCTSMSCPEDAVCDESYLVTGYGSPGADIGQVKQAIMDYGPVIAAVSTLKGFHYDTHTCEHDYCLDQAYGHAVVIVGWDDSENSWIVRNSWGERTQEPNYPPGYLLISYRSCNIILERMAPLNYITGVEEAGDVPDFQESLDYSPSVSELESFMGLGSLGFGYAPGPNPAAQYCGDLGYEYRVRESENGGDRGFCAVSENVEYEAWEFMSGNTGTDYNYCASQGYQTRQVSESCSYTQNCSVCVDSNGREAMEDDLMLIGSAAFKTASESSSARDAFQVSDLLSVEKMHFGAVQLAISIVLIAVLVVAVMLAKRRNTTKLKK